MITLFMFAGEVFDYLVAHGRMKEKEARTKFRQVSNALPSPAHSIMLSTVQREERFSEMVT